MHSCRDNFLLALARARASGMTKRDLPSQHQFLHERAGDAGGRADVSPTASPAPGRYVELRAEMDVTGADLELPAAQQPLQRLQPDADSGDDLGQRVNARIPPAGRPVALFVQRRDDPARSEVARMFNKVLIANRGAIACRIMRTLAAPGHCVGRRLFRADDNSLHVRAGRRGVSHRAGAAPPRATCAQDRILEAARATGAQAIHPGYGFLSENAASPKPAKRAGIAFIGPTPAQMRDFGLKHTRARAGAGAAALPLLPGSGLLADLRGARCEARPHRLSGDAEEHRGRRRHRHAAAAIRRGARATPSPPSQRLAASNFSDGGRVPREVRRARAAHRSADLRRRPRHASSRSASATARCSGATRKSSRKRRRPASTRATRARIAATAAVRLGRPSAIAPPARSNSSTTPRLASSISSK